MVTSTVFTPYSTILPMINTLPSWVSELDQARIAAYQQYEEIYWNAPETFKLVARGSENKPIYIPTARTIIDTTNRYTATGLKFQFDPSFGSPEAITAGQQQFMNLFRRERFLSKFNANKRYGLMRGDWCFHLVADPDKPAGTRISIYALDPASYFPVYDPDNLDHIIKVHIAEQWLDEGGKTWVRRLTYERDDAGAIVWSEGLFDADKWFKEGGAPGKIIQPPTPLPASITAFPVYHIPNFEEPGNPFGSSEIRGFETLQRAINQSVSDEDLALALDGLGLYATASGAPVDEDGNDTDWVLGPGKVVENVSDFNRVTGVGSITPMQDHIKFLIDTLKESSSTPDAAIGKVDATIAESGVALVLQLGPMLSKAEEKDQTIMDVMTQMFFDLKTWIKVYEAVDITATDVIPVFGDKLPKNRKAEVDLVASMMSTTPPLISAGSGRAHLAKFGFEFAENEGVMVAQEQQAHTEVTTPPDAFTSRLNAELGGLANNDATDGATGA